MTYLIGHKQYVERCYGESPRQKQSKEFISMWYFMMKKLVPKTCCGEGVVRIWKGAGFMEYLRII